MIPLLILNWRLFFRVYKELEGKDTAVNEIKGKEEAEEIIESAIQNYIDNYCR